MLRNLDLNPLDASILTPEVLLKIHFRYPVGQSHGENNRGIIGPFPLADTRYQVGEYGHWMSGMDISPSQLEVLPRKLTYSLKVKGWNIYEMSFWMDMWIFAGAYAICTISRWWFQDLFVPLLEPRNPSIGDFWPCELWIAVKPWGCLGNSYGYQKVYSFEALLLGSCFGYDFSPFLLTKNRRDITDLRNESASQLWSCRNNADVFFLKTWRLVNIPFTQNSAWKNTFIFSWLSCRNVGFGPTKGKLIWYWNSHWFHHRVFRGIT